ncbi:MAG: hypothetical protein PWQ81_219 [Bacteroidota bacterium]|jgi:hypothetical protein|nr:hypothetical protein [Methermicoccus sp.]MDI3504997.1 hypothetical protein [Bacteroidota bacterium]MDK2837227.1 hypothetical protein [Bacteroidota bacterium]MDK2968903.1 hypothetical protein [Bacteroidota bacterium]MDN5296083.1 hypothetical protein [Bacteroidota bacterium]
MFSCIKRQILKKDYFLTFFQYESNHFSSLIIVWNKNYMRVYMSIVISYRPVIKLFNLVLYIS